MDEAVQSLMDEVIASLLRRLPMDWALRQVGERPLYSRTIRK